MKNVLIISYHFFPVNNIAAKRYGHMVKYFQQQGWTPWVLTTNSSKIMDDAEMEKRTIRIGQHPQENERVDKLLKSNNIQGWPQKVHAALCSFNFRLRSVDRYMFTWYREVLAQSEDIMARLPKIDLVVASYGPATALWLGRKIAMAYKVPWIADFRDLGALHPRDRSRFSQIVDIQIERFVLASATNIITVSESLAAMLSRTYKKKCEVVYNGWDKDDWGQHNEKGEISAEMPEVYIHYAGSFYKHQMESIKMLIGALKEVGNIILVIRSLGPKYIEDDIMDFALEIGAGDLVRILPPSQLATVYSEAQNSQVNIIFEDLCADHEWSKGTLTGKLFTLLPLEPPILCIARSDSDIGLILEATNKGKLVSSIRSIKEYLVLPKTGSITNNGNVMIRHYTRQMQAKKMTQIFDTIFTPKTLI